MAGLDVLECKFVEEAWAAGTPIDVAYCGLEASMVAGDCSKANLYFLF